MQDRKPETDRMPPDAERKPAWRDRALGLAVALLLFVLIIYIATYARFGV